MQIKFYLKYHGIGGLDWKQAGKVWDLINPKEGEKNTPLLQLPQFLQIEDLILLLQKGILSVERNHEYGQDVLLIELNVQNSAKENWGLSVFPEGFYKGKL